ncbi:hypothetical protein BJ508DRAFT_331077 [Ascobolus immersus RN42]|uniref:Uncharacterized protein n=1 Tax=Ascobolus immersus RN42 TaxID=1160509 RepID=A0A3N4I3T5_ASCIM|nr:hypothetical protein BJ508DRAFT_331077 [Ascobolus immersus RN42]
MPFASLPLEIRSSIADQIHNWNDHRAFRHIDPRNYGYLTNLKMLSKKFPITQIQKLELANLRKALPTDDLFQLVLLAAKNTFTVRLPREESAPITRKPLEAEDQHRQDNADLLDLVVCNNILSVVKRLFSDNLKLRTIYSCPKYIDSGTSQFIMQWYSLAWEIMPEVRAPQPYGNSTVPEDGRPIRLHFSTEASLRHLALLVQEKSPDREYDDLLLLKATEWPKLQEEDDLELRTRFSRARQLGREIERDLIPVRRLFCHSYPELAYHADFAKLPLCEFLWRFYVEYQLFEMARETSHDIYFIYDRCYDSLQRLEDRRIKASKLSWNVLLLQSLYFN